MTCVTVGGGMGGGGFGSDSEVPQDMTLHFSLVLILLTFIHWDDPRTLLT